MTNNDLAKKAAALKALEYVKPGMRLGLGTGSTVAFFIEALGQKVKEGLDVSVMATSKKSEESAKEHGIPLLNPESTTLLDLTIDGADEIDTVNRMIKGGGAALMREKIAAKMAHKMIVMVDASKVVDNLGKHPIPVEIQPWGKEATRHQIEQLGYKGTWREGVTTDNGNVLFDIQLPIPTLFPEKIDNDLLHLPGVLSTGFFFDLASTVIVGYGANEVKIR